MQDNKKRNQKHLHHHDMDNTFLFLLPNRSLLFIRMQYCVLFCVCKEILDCAHTKIMKIMHIYLDEREENREVLFHIFNHVHDSDHFKLTQVSE